MVPPVYVNNGGAVPFGNPVALNASIAVGAVADINAATNGRLNAPFRMSLPQVPAEPHSDQLGGASEQSSIVLSAAGRKGIILRMKAKVE